MKKLISLIATLTLLCVSLCGCTDLLINNNTNILTGAVDTKNSGLVLHFIDVGQGDCILVQSGDDFALIDAGEYSERNAVISYLNRAGVDAIDYMICTHPHSDHCGGLSEVIRNFDTSVFISPDADSDSSSWVYVLDAADERGVTYETPEQFDTYTLGEATITILSPAKDAVYSNLNDYSIVCMVEYGETSFLLTGDAETTVEKELIRSGYDLSADVLKCGHHGSSTSSCDAFLDAVDPSAAIITCGKNNDYGHPHREVVAALTERSIPMWRTDISGSIVASSDGKEITISTEADGTAVLPTGNNSSNHTTASQGADGEYTYVGNKNSMVFHDPDCSSVTQMSDKNKTYFDSRESAVSDGYSPCGSCQP